MFPVILLVEAYTNAEKIIAKDFIIEDFFAKLLITISRLPSLVFFLITSLPGHEKLVSLLCSVLLMLAVVALAEMMSRILPSPKHEFTLFTHD